MTTLEIIQTVALLISLSLNLYYLLMVQGYRYEAGFWQRKYKDEVAWKNHINCFGKSPDQETNEIQEKKND